MSAQGLTSEAQLRYLLQWFEEFSELQREDFLPVLAAAYHDKPEQLAASLAALTCHDKPVSLFQCRIKLFNEWYPTWTEEERDRLIKSVTEIDTDFGNKLQEILTNGPKTNGHINADDDSFPNIVGENNEVETSEVNDTDDNNLVKEEVSVSQENIPIEITAAS